MTKKYELIYVLNGTLRADELRAQMDRVRSVVEASGEIVDTIEWGRRRLAYEIQDIREGYYVLVYFNAESDGPREIERLLRISDSVLRFLIVVAEGDFVPTGRRTLDEEPNYQPTEEASQDVEVAEEEAVEEPVEVEAVVTEETADVVEEQVEAVEAEAEQVAEVVSEEMPVVE